MKPSRLARTLLGITGVVGLTTWAAIVGRLAYRQRLMLYRPVVVPSWLLHERAERAGFKPWLQDEVLVEGGPSPIHAWVWEPETTIQGTIVMFHGSHQTAMSRAVYARYVGALGYRVVLVEYPGFADRSGLPTEMNVLHSNLTAFDAVQARWPGPLIVIGESLGAATAARVVQERSDRITAAVIITPWDRLSEVVKARYWWLPVRWTLREKYDSIAALRDYPGPLTIVAALQDRTIPPHHARALFEAAQSPLKQWVEVDAGHSTWPASVPADFWPCIVRSWSSFVPEAEPQR